MKITYLKLKNFANIYTAMNANEFELDLSKSKNRVILISGPNGSGKTSILSCLHPFATNGTMDIRNDNSLVRIGKDGYKEIHIEDDGIEYLIKHFYTPSKESHTVKSYVIKNGLELNPNGNVTSFKEIIKQELDVELDYMKLARLGSNVTNFIDLKTTERKAFMGKILNEVDIYLKYFKKVSKDITEMKSVISHLIDKINKLNISDLDESESYAKNISNHIKELESQYTKTMQDKAILSNKAKEIGDDPAEIASDLKNAIMKKTKIDKTIESRYESKRNINDCKEELLKISDTILELNTLIENEKTKRTLNLDRCNSLISEKKELENELNKLIHSDKIKDVENIIDITKKSIDNRPHSSSMNLLEYNPSFTKSELELLISTLNGVMNVLSSAYEFGKTPVSKVVDMMMNNENINEYINDSLCKINHTKLSKSAHILLDKMMKSFPTAMPKCGDKKCELYDFWKELYDIISDIPDESQNEYTDEMYTFMKICNQAILQSLDTIAEVQDIINKLPDKLKASLSRNAILMNIHECKYIYDKKEFNDELSIITEYELYLNDIEKLKELRIQLNTLKSDTSSIKFLENRLSSVNDEIESLGDSIENSTDTISELNGRINELDDNKKSIETLIEALENKDVIDETVKSLSEKASLLKEYMIKINDCDSSCNMTKFNIDKLSEEYKSLSYKINEYKEYTKELSKYNKKYDECTLIRNSLSAKEGIPLIYIQLYLRNTKEITNDLLEIIYDNDLYIDDFVISSDEFKIPYVKNNTLIKDAAYASQGEKSFISLALSFALSYQSITRYNVMLLDEIDSTLDTSNRSKFLEILERLIDMIEAEQIFLISHNNMFESYPVDNINLNNANKIGNLVRIEA